MRSKRERRNLFCLSNWFTGTLGPANEGKGNEYVTRSVTENGCLHYKLVLVILTALVGVKSRWYRSHQLKFSVFVFAEI